MYYINLIKNKLLLFLLFFNSVSILSCNTGVQNGDISSKFSGIKDATVISPTSVKLDWVKSSEYDAYEIIANFKDTPLTESVFSSIVVENLIPSTEYSFKVKGKGAALGAGADREVKVITWPKFNGISKLFINSDKHIVLEWEYNYPALEFMIFYRADAAPDAASTNNWEKPNVTTREHSYIFNNLAKSTTFFFTVHVKYKEGEIYRPEKNLVISSSSSFPAPYFELPKITIGALPTILVDPVITDVFLADNYTSQAFYNNIPAADPIRGAGKLVFSSSTSFPVGKIDNITLKIRYKDSKIDETLVIPNLFTYTKKVLPELDIPFLTDSKEAAYMGVATATGDFNCDGYDDLAIGLPYVSLAQYGAAYKNTGAVYIYYGGLSQSGKYVLKTSPSPSLNPVLPGRDPQVITFPDLSENANFGFSLASRGNANQDKNGRYSCDDLLVGAPLQISPNGQRTGNAFLFYGTRVVGLKSPTTVSNFPQNIETCDGRIDSASCTAVRLWPDYSLWPSASLAGLKYTPTYYNNDYDYFGFSVAFIGDFNADGFEDIAVGAPNGQWDGLPPGILKENWSNENVGYVALYFGSNYGLKLETPTSNSNNKFRWLKIYPPIVQTNMYFGYSISAGDVDGKYRVKDDSGKYVGGSDLVVGAPGFRYTNPDNSLYPLSSGDPDQDISVNPTEGGWWGSVGDRANSSNTRYGFSQGGQKDQGIAFLFFGRSLSSPATMSDSNNPSKDSFWSCGKRGMTNKSTHYSCLARSYSFRTLFPRDENSYSFGKSLVVVGDKSARDSLDSFKCPTTLSVQALTNVTDANGVCRDGNGDGFADIIISAPLSDAPSADGRTGVGLLWEYFGNFNQLYEAGTGGSDSFKSVAPYYNTEASCANFALGFLAPGNNSRSVADKVACAPTRLLPNSVPSNANIGLYSQGINSLDVTKDGLMDVIVGAPNDNTRGSGAGAVYVFTSLKGFGITNNIKKMIRNETDNDDKFGSAVAVGDFDAASQNAALDAYTCSSDGTDECILTSKNFDILPLNDIIVGAPYESSQGAAAGGTHVFLSGSFPLPAIRTTSDLSIFDSIASKQNFNYNETRIVGDVNGDGYDDAIAHIKSYNSAGSVVYDPIVYYGSSVGLISPTFCLNHSDQVFLPGKVTLSECSPSFSHQLSITQKEIILPQKIIRPNNVSPRWGEIAFDAGDVNKDGFSDIVLVDPCYSNCSTGQLLLYFGTRGGIQDTVIPTKQPTNGDPQIVTRAIPISTDNISYNSDYYYENYYYKSNFIVNGDFNGDGYSDIAVGAPNASGPALSNPTTTTEGETIIDVGSWPLDSVLEPDGGTTHFIWRCPASAILSTNCKGGSGIRSHGAVFIFYGSRNGFQTPATYQDPSKDINNGNIVSYRLFGTEDDFGQVVENGNTACAASGVCLVTKIENPVLVNIKNGFTALSHSFGSAVTPIKVNNSDTADSLLISAPGYENLNCWNTATPAQLNQGRIYLFRGSSSGIIAAERTKYYPAPSDGAPSKCESMPQTEDTGLGFDPFGRIRAFRMIIAPTPLLTEQVNMTPNTTGRSFGLRMINGGDLNGDGFEDVVISAPYENVYDSTGSVVQKGGSSYVIYGPMCSTDNDTNLQVSLQNPTNVNAQLKYTDISGLSIASACSGKTLAPEKIVIKDIVSSLSGSSGNENDYYGLSLLGGRLKNGKQRGDINLDGYGDIVIGSPNWDDPVSNKSNMGRGIVLFGSSSGLFANDYPSYVVEPLTLGRIRPYIVLSPQRIDGAQFFFGNVSIGDINGDSTMDLMVPSQWYDGVGNAVGIDLGTFFLFY